MKTKRIYLDYNSTTPPLPEAIQGAEKAFQEWGNPSSVHQSAAGAKALLWESRQHIAKLLSCHPLELIFTSGASESNNQAIKGLCLDPENKRNEVILSAVEHPSVLFLGDFLKREGFKVLYVPVSKEGELDESWFDKALGDKTLLVSLMLANNETGVIYPVKKLAKKTKERGAFFHSDMTQGLGKIPISLQDLEVDLASFSGHKFYGLKGCGVLYRKKGVPLENLIEGGPQEKFQRAGTENLPGIAAFGAMAEKGQEIIAKNKEIKLLRDEMEKEILKKIPGIEVIGGKVPRLSNTSCLYISGVYGETLLINLDLKGFSLSAGSACHSGKLEASSVLTAMGLSEEEAKSCLRVSLGHKTRREELKAFVNTLEKTVKKLRSLK